MRTTTYENVPERNFTHNGLARINPAYTRMMKQADKCVKTGGHFVGSSRYDKVYSNYRTLDMTTLHVSMTLYWKE